jgi:hypothetical protein
MNRPDETRIPLLVLFGHIFFGVEQGETMKIKILVSLITALFATGLSDLSISYAAEPEAATVQDFKWGDQTNLKEHLLKHVTFPTTGKIIKETCKNEIPDEFSKEQRNYLDGKLKDDATYNNPEEVMSALNLK